MPWDLTARQTMIRVGFGLYGGGLAVCGLSTASMAMAWRGSYNITFTPPGNLIVVEMPYPSYFGSPLIRTPLPRLLALSQNISLSEIPEFAPKRSSE